MGPTGDGFTLTRRGFLAASAAVTGELVLARAQVTPSAVVLIVSERGLPAADLVRGVAPPRTERFHSRDGWAAGERILVAAPAPAPFTRGLSRLLPRLSAREDLHLSRDLEAPSADWSEALAALDLGGFGVAAEGANLAERSRAALGAIEAGARRVVVRETADWLRPSGLRERAAAVDGAVADLLEDLELRGAADRTLVVLCSAVGRAPFGRVHGWRETAREGALACAFGSGAERVLDVGTTTALRRRAFEWGSGVLPVGGVR